MQQHPILILDISEDVSRLRIEPMSAEFVHREINGEAAFHIYNVRMLTEYILRELSTHDYKIVVPYSEDEISAIAMASTLHDIGKLQIPKSILDFPGTLSPVEYDIVKKHTLLGEESIRAAELGDVSARVAEYAAQIARYHHERIDGMGYPDGLHGQEIPLYAQVVAISDSYDALTGVRSYKQAISQDVALQMIANGHCGAFDQALVTCLGRVVKHQNIIAFRETLEKRRSIVEHDDDLQLNRVLLVGNTEYLDEDFAARTFPGSKVTVINSNGTVASDKARIFRTRKSSVSAFLETYEFDLIVFFSKGLSFHSTEKSDSEELREVLRLASVRQRNARILYLSPLDAVFESHIDRSIIASANEKMCEFYAGKHALNVKIIRIPYLYAGTHKKDFLYQIFEQLYAKQVISISEAASARMHFLSVTDLSDLIVRSIDGWKAGSGILSVGDEFRLTFADLAKKITEMDEDAKIDFVDSDCTGVLKLTDTDLRNQHGWYAKISLVEDLQDQYNRFLATKEKKNFFGKIKDWISGHSTFVKICELFILFTLSELLVRQSGSAVIFAVVDFRTVFIVMMATLYGSIFGVAAAALSSISYIFARVAAGTNALTLFYEPTNWITFTVFFLVGGVCGYIHRKNRDTAKDLEAYTELLQDKLNFTSGLYEDTLQDKRELKKQINSSKDSFGKILDIAQRLNTVAPQQLYLKIMETFEEVLENKSIAIYSITPHTPYGRLQVCSRELADVTARSIELEQFAPVIEKFKDGGVWKNTELNLDYPMYATGIYRENELIHMIFLWHADADQRTLYYTNLFSILCDLAQISFIRAYDHNLALFEKQYIPGTRIMKTPYFEEYLKNYTALKEKKVSSFLLLGIDCHGHTLEEVDQMLIGKIRTTDILGITALNQLQLLLPQATINDLPYILPRYEGLDITVGLFDPDAVYVVQKPEPVPAVRSTIRIVKGILPSAIVTLADTVVDAVTGILVPKKK